MLSLEKLGNNLKISMANLFLLLKVAYVYERQIGKQ